MCSRPVGRIPDTTRRSESLLLKGNPAIVEDVQVYLLNSNRVIIGKSLTSDHGLCRELLLRGMLRLDLQTPIPDDSDRRTVRARYPVNLIVASVKRKYEIRVQRYFDASRLQPGSPI